MGMKRAAAERGLPPKIPFRLTTVAPNLGTGEKDLNALIACIEATGDRPGAIAIDTVSQSLGGGDENGPGMDQFVVNATALANHFQCLVALIHHTPASDDDRMRGKTSLPGGVDVSIVSKHEKGTLVADLAIKKMRDEDDDLVDRI
jgi:AAA domain